METKKSRDTIQSLQTGITIIDVLVESKHPMRFSEIQEKTQITKSNLYKYMNTLTKLELVIREQATGLYHLGNKLIQYGMAAIGNQDTIALITPYLHTISQHSNCSVLFSVVTQNGPVIAKIKNADGILNIGAQMGSVLPQNSSSGKIFNVFSSSDMLNAMQSDPLLTAESKEFQQIEVEKIAFAMEPLISQISSASIPILSYTNELAGIITVVGFTDGIPKSINDPLSVYLVKMQEDISNVFGYIK
ncbi:IclR family transcriptional regulator [Oceanobacillus rekensis]|uniref:IclR family transcriptional regulator n=1 Tax=Oceanobacillus rekensis TaxID=937927 RepID=UPI000B42F0DE|nr:helix-turn-helix domain-containing protein [Oceanobacillus rekensis]